MAGLAGDVGQTGHAADLDHVAGFALGLALADDLEGVGVAGEAEVPVLAGGAIGGAGLAEVVGIAPLTVGALSLCTDAEDEGSDDEDLLQSGNHDGSIKIRKSHPDIIKFQVKSALSASSNHLPLSPSPAQTHPLSLLISSLCPIAADFATLYLYLILL